MESPPEMLEVADDLWLVLSFGQVVVDMQPATGVYPSTDILDDLQRWRQDPFDFIPAQRSRLNFELGPTQSTVLRLVSKRGVVLNGELAIARKWLLRIATRAGLDAVIRQNLSEKSLNVVVGAASDDRSDELDFDADFAIEIDLAFHTEVYRAVPKAQVKSAFCLPLFLGAISASETCSNVEDLAAVEQFAADDGGCFDTLP